MWHSATQGGRMEKRVFCRKHYRRAVEYVPVIVPIYLDIEINGQKMRRTDYEYLLRCPVCWEKEKIRRN